MTLDQLRMLVAVADTGSVLAAAEALGRTQPTVSVGIRKLEDDLGLQLLSRDGYRARLTTSGEAICQQARLLLGQAAEMRNLAAYLAAGREPELTIAIEASCPITLTIGVLRQAEKQFVSTRFHLLMENIWGALDRLRLGEADLAITPWFREEEGFESVPLGSIQLITVAAPGVFAAADERPLQISDLSQAVQVVVRDSSRQPPDFKFGLIEGGRRWMVNDHETKKRLLLAGMGWGRLQRHIIEDELSTGRLIPLQVERYQAENHVELRIARRLKDHSGPVAQAVWELFCNAAQQRQTLSG